MAALTTILKSLVDRLFPEEAAQSASYKQGFGAEPDATNPYRDGTSDHEQWAKGHASAEIDRRAW